ncbi:MAG: hypothetical protein U0235_33800 [Polyangiaceae bacterium]
MNAKTKIGIIVGFVVLLAVGGAVAAKMEEKKVGDACETYRSSDCAGPGGACLTSSAGNYCSITCGGDGECPSGFKCAPITATNYKIEKGNTTKTDEQSVKMCVRGK